MKRKIFLVAVLVMSAIMMSCTKEGPAGADGKDGKDGLDGQDGNANVSCYYFTDAIQLSWWGNAIEFPYTETFFIPDSIRDFGVVLVYTKIIDFGSSLWYPVPGIGLNSYYNTRFFMREDMLRISAYNLDGTPYSGTEALPVLTAVKIVLVPASNIIQIAAKKDKVNFNDYEETMEYFNIEK